MAPKLWGYISSGSVLHLNPLPFIRAIRAVQIFFLEFSKDGSADLGDEFADDGAANQRVILQRGVGLSSGQVSQGFGQFQFHFNAVVNAFLDEVKKGRGHPDKILTS